MTASASIVAGDRTSLFYFQRFVAEVRVEAKHGVLASNSSSDAWQLPLHAWMQTPIGQAHVDTMCLRACERGR